MLQKFNQSLIPVFSNQSFQQELQQKLGVSSAIIRKAIEKLNHYLKNDPNISTSTAVILLFITLGG
ncbi:HTH domain-containing protein [Lactobacillus mellis]|nr:HTH domain-containing protein [Bombilactobacillus mellis]